MYSLERRPKNHQPVVNADSYGIDSTIVKDIDTSLTRLQQVTHIQEAMSINNVIDPVSEIVEDREEEIEDQILQQFNVEWDIETDEAIEETPPVTITEAIVALCKLQLHGEQSSVGDHEVIQLLDAHENVLTKMSGSVITTTGNYFIFFIVIIYLVVPIVLL